ncbi:stress response protein SCP2 [Streptomyces sp. MJP52]|nr:stress response protein SCP2 [Streptomyces sp. MJP52]
MAVSLSKGGNVSLTKEAPGLTAVTVGLGWDVRTTTGTDFDLDASAIAVTAAGRGLRGHVLRLLQQQGDA